MANNLTNNPLLLDTAMGANLGRSINVTHILISGGSTDSAYRITDGSAGALVIAEGQALALTSFDLPINKNWADMRLTVITGTGALVCVFYQ